MAKRVKIKPRILQDKVVRLADVRKDTWDFPRGGVVYLITHVGDGRKYVGMDTKPPNRLLEHARCGSSSKYLSRAVSKYGAANFTAQILAVGVDSVILPALEKSFIAVHNCNHCRSGWGYNLTDGGEGTSGYKDTDEQRATKSVAQKKRWAENPATDEERAAMSELKKKYHAENPDARAAMSERTKKHRAENPEWGAAQSARMKKRYAENPATDEERAAQSERMEKYWAENPVTDEARAARSDGMKKYYAENPDARAAQSESVRGEKNPMHGKSHTPEVRAALRETMRGRRLVIVDGKRRYIRPEEITHIDNSRIGRQ